MTPNPNPAPELLRQIIRDMLAGKQGARDAGRAVLAVPQCPACDGTKVVSQGGHDTGCDACYVSPQALPAPGEVERRHWQQAIGNEIARQCDIGAGTCGNADDGSGLFEVDASLDLNGFAAAMKHASLATVAAANDEGVARIIAREAVDIITDLIGPQAAQSETNCRVVEDHLRQLIKSLTTSRSQHEGASS